MMQKIDDKYQRNNNEYSLTMELTNLACDRSTSAEQYINRFYIIRRKFKTADKTVKDERFILKLIQDMPSCLNTTREYYRYKIHVEDEKIDVYFDFNIHGFHPIED
jgi:hypothetical protein